MFSVDVVLVGVEPNGLKMGSRWAVNPNMYLCGQDRPIGRMGSLLAGQPIGRYVVVVRRATNWDVCGRCWQGN